MHSLQFNNKVRHYFDQYGIPHKRIYQQGSGISAGKAHCKDIPGINLHREPYFRTRANLGSVGGICIKHTFT